MKKEFGYGALFGLLVLVCIGATGTLISGYPDRGPLINTDYLLVDTGTNYGKVTWGQITAYTDGVSNSLRAMIVSSTNLIYSASSSYTDTATNDVLSTATDRIVASTNSILTDPIVTGSLTIVGGSGTNEFYGVNIMTNINSMAISSKTNAVITPGPATNTLIYPGLQ